MDQDYALHFLADKLPASAGNILGIPGVAWLAGGIGLALGLLVLAWHERSQRKAHRELGRVLAQLSQGDFQEPFGVGPQGKKAGLGQGLREELKSGLSTLAQVLRERTRSVEQSERLLHMLIDATPMAILLLEDTGDIEYANETAKELFFEGRPLGKQNFLSLLEQAPAPLREAVLDVQDRFFVVEQNGSSETYHLAKRHFELRGRTHTLLMVKQLTREVRRQEIDVWKKLIRVLSHELNNSLAPITSLVHSARVLTKPEATDKLARVFSTIEERALHLQQFVEGYAKFARLPPPKREHVNLSDFLQHIEALVPHVLVPEAPVATAYMDRSQMEQVIINLLKNAQEAGGPAVGSDEPQSVPSIELTVEVARSGAATFEVLDRGPGMSEQVLANAMLPFYSTKERGSGLGLALCREITEAHGGTILLRNRASGGLCVTISLPGFERQEVTQAGKLTLSRL